MMLRATVVDVDPRDPTRVWVTIPQKYGAKPVRVFTRVEVTKGDHVYVTNTSVTRVPQWVVFGQQTEIGRWGNPYPHTHPIGQVDGLVDALGKKIDRAELDKKADTAALEGKADKATTPTTADVTGQWVSLRSSLGTGWVPSTYDAALTQQGVEVKRTLSTIIMNVNIAPVNSSTSPSGTLFTLPPAYQPGKNTWTFVNAQVTNTYGVITIVVNGSSSRNAGVVAVVAGPPPAGQVVRLVGTLMVGT